MTIPEKEIVLLSEEDIKSIVSRLAAEISRDYSGKTVVFVGVLKGAFIFLADLVRKVKGVHVEIDFVRVRSYGDGTSPVTKPVLEKDVEIDLTGKEVLIVEDIIDTGETLEYLIKHIWSKKPAGVRVCTFVDKRERRSQNTEIHYSGYSIDSGFVIGYGMDVGEKKRELSELKMLVDTTE